MILKKCRCGKTAKNFKFDLGIDFYIDECCETAGFDYLGNLKAKVEVKLEEPEKVVEVKPEIKIEDKGKSKKVRSKKSKAI